MQIRVYEDEGTIQTELANSHPHRPSDDDLKALLVYTANPREGGMTFNALQANFAERAARLDPVDRPLAKREMADEIDWLEAAAYRHRHHRLFRAAASMSEFFSTWFCHTSLGEDKRPALERSLRLLSEQTKCACSDPAPLLMAARLRIFRPQIRDLVDARRLVTIASSYSVLSKEQRDLITSLRSELDRKECKLVLPVDFDYTGNYDSNQELLLAKTLRQQFRKAKDTESLGRALTHLYRIAFIAEVERHIELRLTSKAREPAMKTLRDNRYRVLALTYADNGKILPTYEVPLLGVNDYRAFVHVWGLVDKWIDPLTFFGIMPARLRNSS